LKDKKAYKSFAGEAVKQANLMGKTCPL
jgi:hypothetical protein